MGEGMVERYSERRSEAAAELDFDRIPHPSDVNLRWAIATIAGLEMPHWLLHQINDHLDGCSDCSSRVRRWRYKALISGREVFVGRSDISIG